MGEGTIYYLLSSYWIKYSNLSMFDLLCTKYVVLIRFDPRIQNKYFS